MADAKSTKKQTKKVVEVKSLDDLKKDLEVAQKELLDAKKGLRANELVNPHTVTVKRKEIARIKTAIVAESRKENA